MLEEDILSFSVRSNDIEENLNRPRRQTFSVVAGTEAGKRTKLRHGTAVYMNGKRINQELDRLRYEPQPAAYTSQMKKLPKDSHASHDCPAEYAMSERHGAQFRNLSMRHPRVMLEYNQQKQTPPIVILTPISNVARQLPQYIANLCSLTYPHSQISIVLGEDSSSDSTYDDALVALKLIKTYFRSVKLFRLKRNENPWPYEYRHDEAYQRLRRAHLARSRNQLLSVGLQDEAWVLWLDADVRYIPPDLIQQLMSAQQGIVAAACMYIKPSGQVDIYDRNTWRETEESRNFLRKHEDDFLMLEGYAPSMRLYLDDLRGGQRAVKVDGVGGCALLIKAEVHRDGLIFPPFIFGNEIETEALARMATAMGYQPYGMPYVEVYH